MSARHQYKSVLSKNFTPRRHRFSLLFHEVGHMQFSRAASQDLHPRVSHYHGLLELGRQLAVRRHGGPVVWPRLVGPHAWSNKSCTTYLLWKIFISTFENSTYRWLELRDQYSDWSQIWLTLGNHWFDGKCVSRLHHPHSFVFSVMGDIGRAVEQLMDPCQRRNDNLWF